MKKLLSLLLSLSILFSMSISALAYESQSFSNDEIVLRSNGHGEYSLINSASSNLKNSMKNSDDIITAMPTADSEIYHIKDNQYLTLTHDNNYLLTDKITIQIDNFSANEETLNQYDVSDDLRDEMRAVIAAQKSLGNNDLAIELYAPSAVSNEILPLVALPPETTYYTYRLDGTTFNMKDYMLKYVHLSASKLEKNGSEALSKAKVWKDFAVSAGGAISKSVTAFGVFSSAYALFKEYRGEVITGSSNDQVYTNLVYDRVTKETYVQEFDGSYVKGCVSYKAWLDRHDSYQFYGSTGKSYFGQHKLDAEHYSENFRSPAVTAIRHGTTAYVDAFQYVTALDMTVRLMGY